jgi:hypothetical protein
VDFPQCVNLRFCDLRTIYIFAICGFMIIFCGLKTSANPQIHNFSRADISLKYVLSFKFKDDLWLLGVTWHFVI